MKFSSLSEQKIEDFAKLSKVWGLVKYYHPKVVSGDINWDNELFRVMPSILEENSDVDSILYEWVHTLGNENVPGISEQLYQILRIINSSVQLQIGPRTRNISEQI